MALINCPQCGKQISDKAVKCPHCGLNFATQSTTEARTTISEVAKDKEKHGKKWLILTIYALCLAAAIAALWVFVIADIFENKNTNNARENTEIVINADTKILDSNVPNSNTPNPSVPEKKYLTQDLRMWGLFGPVRDFRISVSNTDNPSRQNEEMLSIQYDAQGHFSNTIDGNFSKKEIAKKDGDRVIEAKRYLGEFGCISKQWSYYPNGLVKQSEFLGYEYGDDCQYYYNDAGELTRTETNSGFEGTMLKTITTYLIKDRDEYGNWTKQIAEVTESEFNYETNEYVTSAVWQEMYTRTIHYYGQNTTGQYVIIDATELRLRLGPSTSAGILKWGDGSERYPNKGEKYLYLGESGDFYKINYKGQELWVSKKYTYLE